MDIKCITYKGKGFPEMLKKIENPPDKLYYIGDLSLVDSRCVAVVGSRKTSDYGFWVATNMAKKLVDYNITVVSGMAKGIDTFAHRSALKNQGKTIAVLGTGIDLCFPSANIGLRNEIINKGLILSEYPPGYPGDKWTFPRRNRIISGLSEATVVAEAGLHSGAMITAELAVEQGRLVYAVPGNINNLYNMGNNKLIVDGVTPLIVIDDILDDLGINRKNVIETELMLGDDEKRVLKELLQGKELTIEQLSIRVGLKPSIINGLVTVLEMKGIAITSLGKVFIAK